MERETEPLVTGKLPGDTVNELGEIHGLLPALKVPEADDLRHDGAAEAVPVPPIFAS
jgi:hypothetical protein